MSGTRPMAVMRSPIAVGTPFEQPVVRLIASQTGWKHLSMRKSSISENMVSPSLSGFEKVLPVQRTETEGKSQWNASALGAICEQPI